MNFLEFEYRPKFMVMVGGVIFFSLATVGAVYAAKSNDRGLIINGIIELSQNGATILFWCIAAITMAFIIMGFIGVCSSLTSRAILRVTEFEISVPKRFSNKIIVIPLSDIQELSIYKVERQRFLKLIHTKGKLSIAGSFLPSTQALDDIYAFLMDKLGWGSTT